MDGEDNFHGFPDDAEARRLQQVQQQQRLEQQRLEQHRLEQQRLEQQRLLQQQAQQQPHPPSQNPSTEAIMAQLVSMMGQMMQQQQQFFAGMAANASQVPSNPERILDSLSSNMKEFCYDAENNFTFGAWYSRYEDLFTKDASRLSDDAKVRLLLRKLGMAEHERYVSFILPLKPGEVMFDMTVEKLTSLFDAKQSLVSKRYRCLQVSKQPTEDYTTYGCRINKLCVEFDLKKMTEEQFKCLIFVCGLKSEGDAEIRTRLLSKIEEKNVTLQQLSEECQRLLNLKHDNEMIETQTSNVNAVQQRADRKHTNKREQKSPTPPTDDSDDQADDASDAPSRPCWLCGAMHYTRNCGYKKHKCSDCSAYGHREGYCLSAKPKKGKKRKTSVSSNVLVVNENTVHQQRRYVPVELSGKTFRLQLDTASDVTVISKQLWEKLGSPTLSSPSVRSTTASGSTLPLMGEFLCDLTIAGITRMEVVRVTVKPLQLLGADLIDSFGLWSMPMDKFCCNASDSPVQPIRGGRGKRSGVFVYCISTSRSAPDVTCSSQHRFRRNLPARPERLRQFAKHAPKPPDEQHQRIRFTITAAPSTTPAEHDLPPLVISADERNPSTSLQPTQQAPKLLHRHLHRCKFRERHQQRA